MGWLVVEWVKNFECHQMVHHHNNDTYYWVRSYTYNTKCSKCEAQAPDELITQYLLMHPIGLFEQDDEGYMGAIVYCIDTKQFTEERNLCGE